MHSQDALHERLVAELELQPDLMAAAAEVSRSFVRVAKRCDHKSALTKVWQAELHDFVLGFGQNQNQNKTFFGFAMIF